MSECVRGCRIPTSGTALCKPCVGRMTAALGALPDLAAELEVLLSRQAVMVEGAGRVSGNGETPLPFHAEASRQLHLLRTRLVGCVRDLAGDEAEVYPADTIAAMAAWLKARTDDIARHGAAVDFYDDIVGSCEVAWRVVDLAANRTRFPVGPCPGEHVGDDCDGQVWAVIPTDAEHGVARLECRSCGARWEAHEWRRAGRRILAKVDSSTPRRPLPRSA